MLSVLNSLQLQTLVLLCSPLQCEKEHSLQISAAHAWLRPVMQLNKNSYWFHSYPLRCTKVNTLDCDYLIEPVLSVREINGATFFFAQSYFVDIKFIWCKFFFKQMWCHLDCYSEKNLIICNWSGWYWDIFIGKVSFFVSDCQ